MKTIEEEAPSGFCVPENYKYCKGDCHLCGPYVCARREFYRGVELSQRWIPVEEELPEDFKVVLVKDIKHRVFTAKITPASWVDQQRLKYCQYGITHWRHIELK
jgi:hypothetical protein